MIWASLLLLLPAWGLQHDLSYEKIPQHLTTEGSSTGAAWTKFSNGEQLTLRYECEPKIGCSTHPSSAVFEFEKGQLISATLDFSRERGPRTRDIRDVFQEASRKLGRVVASGRSVGRVLHYYTFKGMTVALAQDGDGGQAKIYVDRYNPIGLAEIAAFGGPSTLGGFPGAQEYRSGFAALLDKQWQKAVNAFGQVLEVKPNRLTQQFRKQTEFILAMSIAAALKSEFEAGLSTTQSWKEKADRALQRARSLAPSLKPQLDQLSEQFNSDRP